jgi:transposase
MSLSEQGRTISPDIKKSVVKIKTYFDRISRNQIDPGETSVEKAARALDLGVVTVKRILADFNRDPSLLDRPTPPKGRPSYVLPDSLQSITREYIRNANYEGRFITQETLRQHLLEKNPGVEIELKTLGRALDRWGFAYGKGIRSQHLKEKDHVIAARQRYLRQKRENRRGDKTIRPEVYLDEFYVNKNHSNDFTWYADEDGPVVQKPTGAGERLIILNAITREGWVPNAKLTFKSTKRTGDYHGQVTHELFTKWFEEKLLPNIPEHSIIIMDNASYHNVLSACSAPTPTCKKIKIRDWLIKNQIPTPTDCLKAELVEILNKMAPKPTYEIDLLAEKYEHTVLRTPPYHPELQPIEICWGIVKNQVARNCNFSMSNLLVQIEAAFSTVTNETCLGIIKKIQQVEDDFWQVDATMDEQ